MKRVSLVLLALFLAGGFEMAAASDIQWMAHRGGGLHDRPDNTIAAFLYAWSLGGIPEADVQPTADGVFICLHDDTLSRTGLVEGSLAKTPVDRLAYAKIKDVDVGSKFSPDYASERIPLLEEVFALMKPDPSRRIYLDLKTDDLEKLASLIGRFGIADRVYVSSPDIAQCQDMRARLSGVKTLLWCGGTPTEIAIKFEKAKKQGFAGLDQIQFHLNAVSLGKGWKYAVSADFLKEAADAVSKAGKDFQVYPKAFEARDMVRLLEMGISWYVTDEPARFLETLSEWKAAR